jgi:hypothetical protein
MWRNGVADGSQGHLGLGHVGARGLGGAEEGVGVPREGGDAFHTWLSVHVMGPERPRVLQGGRSCRSERRAISEHVLCSGPYGPQAGHGRFGYMLWHGWAVSGVVGRVVGRRGFWHLCGV